MRRILINATHPQEVRVALTDQVKGRNGVRNVLTDFQIEQLGRESIVGNIYKGRVTAVKNDLDAAFVDYGDAAEGLLPLNRIMPQVFDKNLAELNGGEKTSISDILHEGQELVVQISRDPRGSKGSALTTAINLHGQHVILKTSPSAMRISRQILGKDRSKLRELLGQLDIPKDVGLVLRTSAAGKNHKTMQADINDVVGLWEAIKKAADEHAAPRLLYKDNSMVCRVLRDNLHKSIDEVVIDNRHTHDDARQYVRDFMPDFQGKIRLYASPRPLFSRFRIEPQVGTIFSREVRLPSGGSVVFDQTEALLAIDVNTSRAKKQKNFTDMALHTNLEAADEIMRQLRLRDVGGLIVIDFIDVESPEAMKQLENRIQELVNQDRTQMKFEPLSRFGLLQIQRQRLRPSILDTSFTPCTACGGRGYVRSTQSTALGALREIEYQFGGRDTQKVMAHVNPTVATYIRNQLRQELLDIEERSGKVVEIVPEEDIDQSEFEVYRLRNRDAGKDGDKAEYRRRAQRNARRNDQRDAIKDTHKFASKRLNNENAAVTRGPRTAGPVRASERSISPLLSKVGSGLTTVFSATGSGFSAFVKRLFVVEAQKSNQKAPSRNQAKKQPARAKEVKAKTTPRKQSTKQDASKSRTTNADRSSKRRSNKGSVQTKAKSKSGEGDARSNQRAKKEQESKPKQAQSQARDNRGKQKQAQSSQKARPKSQQEIEKSARVPRKKRSDPGDSASADVAVSKDRDRKDQPTPDSVVATKTETESQQIDNKDSSESSPAQVMPKVDQTDNSIDKSEVAASTQGANTDDAQANESVKTGDDASERRDARSEPKLKASDGDEEKEEKILEIPVDVKAVDEAEQDAVVEASELHEGDLPSEIQEQQDVASSNTDDEKPTQTKTSNESGNASRALNDPRARRKLEANAPPS